MNQHYDDKAGAGSAATDEQDAMQDVGRRQVLKSALGLGAVAIAPAIWTSKAQAQTRTLVVRDPAGPYVKAMTEAFYLPFEKATGVKIDRVTADHEPTSQFKAMVETKN